MEESFRENPKGVLRLARRCGGEPIGILHVQRHVDYKRTSVNDNMYAYNLIFINNVKKTVVNDCLRMTNRYVNVIVNNIHMED